MRDWVLLCISISFVCCIASASPPVCPRQLNPLSFDAVGSQCPLSFPKISPREVNGDIFESVITSKRRGVFTSVLFYASDCLFSHHARRHFEVLSSIYPQIDHLVVEQSSALPSLFSRYGIHSVPALLIVNGTSRVRYHGAKNLGSLIQFYKRMTGYKPVSYIMYGENEPYPFSTANPSDSLETRGKFIMQSWIGLSAREILQREPYLVFAVIFLCLSQVVYVFPRVLHHLRGIWVLYGPHLNMQIFGETSQIMGRILHMMDVKRVWNKLRLCKSRNLHRGARNARVWASSLTSVSLGETSATRS